MPVYPGAPQWRCFNSDPCGGKELNLFGEIQKKAKNRRLLCLK